MTPSARCSDRDWLHRRKSILTVCGEKPKRNSSRHSKGNMFLLITTTGLNEVANDPPGTKSRSHCSPRASGPNRLRCHSARRTKLSPNSATACFTSHGRSASCARVLSAPQTTTVSKPAAGGSAAPNIWIRWVTPPPRLRLEASMPRRMRLSRSTRAAGRNGVRWARAARSLKSPPRLPEHGLEQPQRRHLRQQQAQQNRCDLCCHEAHDRPHHADVQHHCKRCRRTSLGPCSRRDPKIIGHDQVHQHRVGKNIERNAHHPAEINDALAEESGRQIRRTIPRITGIFLGKEYAPGIRLVRPPVTRHHVG